MDSRSSKRDWKVFTSALFFVLGFSLIFSLLGVLLQTVLADVSYRLQQWLGWIGGTIIILFGLYLLGLIKLAFLERERRLSIRQRFRSHYLTSFVFGAAFAVGWTPCVGAALGAILTLATTAAGSAFLLLIAYTLGLGIPFLLVGLFTNESQRLIAAAGKWLRYVQYIFGVILIIMGILVFTGDLNRVANLEFAVNLLSRFEFATRLGEGISSLNLLSLSISFMAGLVSFLSPCVLPLIPGFLTYLASAAVQRKNHD